MSPEPATSPPTPKVERDLGRDVFFPIEIAVAIVLTVGSAVGGVWLIGRFALHLTVPIVMFAFCLYIPVRAFFETIRKPFADAAIHRAAHDVQEFPNNALLHYRLAELYAYRSSLRLTAEHIHSAVQEEALKHLALAFTLGLDAPYDPRRNPNLMVLRENYRFGEVLGIWDKRPRTSAVSPTEEHPESRG